MADLNTFFKKKEPANVSDSNAPSPAPNPAVNAGAALANPFGRKPASESHELEATPANESPAPAPKLAGIFGKSTGPAAGATQGSSPAKSGDGNPVGDSGNEAAHSDSAVGLDALDDAFSDARELREPVRASQFDDETPATAPTRELPDDLDASHLQFVELIDNVYGLLHDTELLANVIKSIMTELQTHPQYMKLVSPTDVRTWVRAMRNGMGLARVKKQEKKEKTSTRKTKVADAEWDATIAELGITFD